MSNLPAPPQGKPEGLFDTECYTNYWLLKFRVRKGPLFTFELRSGESFSAEQRERIDWLFQNFLVVSFNGNYYDVPMIAGALCGFTCEQLKWLSDRIIVEQTK